MKCCIPLYGTTDEQSFINSELVHVICCGTVIAGVKSGMLKILSHMRALHGPV